jgi:hypothetical protein
MRMRRAHEHGVAHALLLDIIDEPAASANEGVVLDAGAEVMIRICSHDRMDKRAERFMEAARAAP